MAKSVIIVCLFFLTVTAQSPSPKIVGGDFAKENEFPFQISLRQGNSHTCEGSIITRNFVITAAHCVTNGKTGQTSPAQNFQVVAGTNLLSSGGVRRNVTNIIVHEKYGNFRNDIALLELSEPFTFNDSIKNISLRTTELPDNAEVVISGWGLIYGNGPISNRLKFNTLRSASRPQCRIIGGIYYDCVMCLKHTRNNGACSGDSGGPAIYRGELVGVANFVINGCGSTYPDGYAKISYFVNWIKLKVY